MRGVTPTALARRGVRSAGGGAEFVLKLLLDDKTGPGTASAARNIKALDAVAARTLRRPDFGSPGPENASAALAKLQIGAGEAAGDLSRLERAMLSVGGAAATIGRASVVLGGLAAIAKTAAFGLTGIGFGVFAARAAADVDALRQSLRRFLGDEAEANQQLKDIQRAAIELGAPREELLDAAVRLAKTRVEYSTDAIKNIFKATAGDKKELDAYISTIEEIRNPESDPKAVAKALGAISQVQAEFSDESNKILVRWRDQVTDTLNETALDLRDNDLVKFVFDMSKRRGELFKPAAANVAASASELARQFAAATFESGPARTWDAWIAKAMADLGAVEGSATGGALRRASDAIGASMDRAMKIFLPDGLTGGIERLAGVLESTDWDGVYKDALIVIDAVELVGRSIIGMGKIIVGVGEAVMPIANGVARAADWTGSAAERVLGAVGLEVGDLSVLTPIGQALDMMKKLGNKEAFRPVGRAGEYDRAVRAAAAAPEPLGAGLATLASDLNATLTDWRPRDLEGTIKIEVTGAPAAVKADMGTGFAVNISGGMGLGLIGAGVDQ